jgi:hypothetical protein
LLKLSPLSHHRHRCHSKHPPSLIRVIDFLIRHTQDSENNQIYSRSIKRCSPFPQITLYIYGPKSIVWKRPRLLLRLMTLHSGYSWIFVHIRYSLQIGHTTLLWFDHSQKTYEWFDPLHNGDVEGKEKSKHIANIFLLELNKKLHNRYVQTKTNQTYPTYGNQRVGPQTVCYDDNEYCMIWCAMFIHLKSMNKVVSSIDIWHELFQDMIQKECGNSKRWKTKLKQYILQYSERI